MLHDSFFLNTQLLSYEKDWRHGFVYTVSGYHFTKNSSQHCMFAKFCAKEKTIAVIQFVSVLYFTWYLVACLYWRYVRISKLASIYGTRRFFIMARWLLLSFAHRFSRLLPSVHHTFERELRGENGQCVERSSRGMVTFYYIQPYQMFLSLPSLRLRAYCTTVAYHIRVYTP